MRYTTIIDIREIPEVYRNPNVRLLYLHLCLIAGYHDNDRDVVRCSLRQLEAQTGLTLSAVRNAMSVLSKWRLIQGRKGVLRVAKYVAEDTITPRPKTRRQQEAKQAAAMEAARRDQAAAERDAERTRRAALRAIGTTDLIEYYREQERKAAAGDADAAKIVARRRQQYEEALRQLNNA